MPETDVHSYEGPESKGGPGDDVWADIDHALAEGVDPFAQPQPEEPPDTGNAALDVPGDPGDEGEDIPEVPKRESKEPEGSDSEAPEIDYDMVVPMGGDGQTMTLGQLKDIAQKTDQDFQNRSLELMHKEQAIDRLIQGVKLSDEQEREFQAYTDYRNQQKQLEVAQTKRMHPEWTDESIFQADNQAMWETWLQYRPTSVEYRNLTDPGLIQMLYDLTNLRAEKARAVEAIKKVKSVPKVPKGRTTQPEAPTNPAKSLNKIFQGALEAGKTEYGEVPGNVWDDLDTALRG